MEVYSSYFIHSVNQVKLQYINKQSSMRDIIMNNTGIGIIKIRMIIFSLFYATIMQLMSILYLSYNSQTGLCTLHDGIPSQKGIKYRNNKSNIIYC